MYLLLQVFFFIFLEQKNKKKQMNYLIQCCDAIIEQKDFSIIDGESKKVYYLINYICLIKDIINH